MSDETYRAFFENLLEGVVLYEPVRDPDGAILDWRPLALNHSAAEHMAWHDRELRPDGPRLVYIEQTARSFDPELKPEALRAWARVLSTGQAHVVETTIRGRRYRGSTFRVAPDRIAMCFTDLTEQQRALDEAREGKLRLELAIRASNTGLWDWDLRSNRVYFSPEWKRQIGYAEGDLPDDFAEWRSRVHPDDLERVTARIEAFLRASSSAQLENEFRFRHRDGSYRWILARGSIVFDEAGRPARLLGSHLDITERKEAEAERERLIELARSATVAAGRADRRAADILENVSDAFVSLDREWRYTHVNEKAAQIFGRRREDLIGKHIWTDFPEGVGQPFQRAYERAMAEQKYTELEEYYPPYDRWFENRIHPSAHGLAIFFHDITARKKAEQVASRATRAFRALSEANEALLRAVDESELLERICRIAVESGGYRLAWVGFAEEDAEKTVRPGAQAGFQADLAGLKITWGEGPLGAGPTGVAIRTGRPCLLRNLREAEAFAPWRDRAVRYELSSALSLPLSSGGRTFGALSLYATEPGAFDPQEVAVIERLRDNLVIGIGALRARAARLKAEAALRDSEEKLRAEVARLAAIFAAQTDAVYVLEPDGVVRMANASGKALFRFDPTGMPLSQVADRLAFRTPSWSPTLQALQGHLVEAAEYDLTFPDGTRRHVMVSAAPTLDEQGRVTGAVTVVRDVTVRVREQEALRALTARLLTVREEEKARMARDLHDDLGQLLTAVKMDVRWIERKLGSLPGGEGVNATIERVTSASELLDRMMATVQRVAAELRPSVLSQLGLAAALSHEARRFTERTGIECSVVIAEEPPHLNDRAATALYRVAQEALTNVARHAEAHHVNVSLAVEETNLVLRVEDDGKGFDPKAHGHSLGLLGMKERALALGGEFRLGPGTGGRGSVAIVVVPLEGVVASTEVTR